MRTCCFLVMATLLVALFLVFYFAVGLSFLQSMWWSTALIAGLMLVVHVANSFFDEYGRELNGRIERFK